MANEDLTETLFLPQNVKDVPHEGAPRQMSFNDAQYYNDEQGRYGAGAVPIEGVREIQGLGHNGIDAVFDTPGFIMHNGKVTGQLKPGEGRTPINEPEYKNVGQMIANKFPTLTCSCGQECTQGNYINPTTIRCPSCSQMFRKNY